MTIPPQRISFTRLPQIPPAEILAHMTDPRTAEHLPLLTSRWTLDTVAEFVAAKEARWQRDGLGHWAFLGDGAYLGWGGFQKEGADWDFGLVLTPAAFGLGPRIWRKAHAFATADPRLPSVTFLLPPSRTRLAALRRLGAQPCGEVVHDGTPFLKFRLDTH